MKYKKGTIKLHVPYMPPIYSGNGLYEDMHKHVEEQGVPDETASYEIIHRVYVDLEDTRLSHDSSEVIYHRKLP